MDPVLATAQNIKRQLTPHPFDWVGLEKFSLSRYFPKDTEYFYGYPAEEDSHFFNGVPPEIEELVAARPMICAGPTVKTICFSATVESPAWDIMLELGIIDETVRKNLIILPKEIDHHLRGAERNKRIKEVLASYTTPGKLVMAQPYLDPRLKNRYAIPPHRTIWLNDKRNMASYIPWQYLTKTYDEFLDGQCFEDSFDQIALPCVVKVSSSSSGDGVRICESEDDIESAKEAFSKIDGIVLVSERINVKQNWGVKFGIPWDPDQAIEIIGWHEQLTDERGAFIGGILEPKKTPDFLKPLSRLLREKILPEVRRKGWFGIGGFDILMNEDDRFYFIDPNFRMTGMSVYDLLVKNGKIKKSLLSFVGSFEGSETQFRATVLPRVKQSLDLSCLTHHDGIFRFGAAVLFEDRRELKERIQELLSLGVLSNIFQRVLKHMDQPTQTQTLLNVAI